MNTFSFKPPKPQVKVGVTPPAGEANGNANGNGLPVTTIVLPSTPSPDLSPNPNGGLEVRAILNMLEVLNNQYSFYESSQ